MKRSRKRNEGRGKQGHKTEHGRKREETTRGRKTRTRGGIENKTRNHQERVCSVSSRRSQSLAGVVLSVRREGKRSEEK